MQPNIVNSTDAIVCESNSGVTHTRSDSNESMSSMNNVPGDDEDTSPTSLMKFLNHEQECMNSGNDSDVDVDSIFEEINRLTGDSEDRSVDDILREAELLLSKQENLVDGTNDTLGEILKTISEESTPREMKSGAEIDQLEINKINATRAGVKPLNENFTTNSLKRSKSREKLPKKLVAPAKWNDKPIISKANPTKSNGLSTSKYNDKEIRSTILSKTSNVKRQRDNVIERRSSIAAERRESPDLNGGYNEIQMSKSCTDFLSAPEREIPLPTSFTSSALFSTSFDKETDELPTPTNTNPIILSSRSVVKSPSPIPSITPSNSFSWSRERALEQQIESLQEKLKDTEERLQSLRLQHDTMSQAQRALRDTNHQLQEQSERLKIDVQHLNECANLLRAELQSARKDRCEATEVQKVLQRELEESREERRKVSGQADGNERTIMDLQRQCKEMERIVMRKNPDFMSGLMGAGSKRGSGDDKAAAAAKRVLEQRIAQLETDAKEQDKKAQTLLSNVQSRFNSVQSKYETHISDLETQVLNLQQINARLNEKIEAQSRLVLLSASVSQICSSTQTIESGEPKTSLTCNAVTQTDFKEPATVKSPGSAPKKLKEKPMTNGKDDAHLMATIRGMRVDLAIKEKAMQRLTRELDECKKSMKKLQKERDVGVKGEKSPPSTTARKLPEVNSSSSESTAAALKEALNKIKLLEGDYKSLHDKRLQDLKILQAAHERELSSCHETVRMLEQRLVERDEAFAVIQKRHKVPVDYFALKAKVTSLEQRHTEREKRLHILVEALSKGRINGALDHCVGDGV